MDFLKHNQLRRDKMKKLIIITIALLMLTGAAFAKDITISGSTTVFPIAQKCAEIFMDANPEINISVRGGGSGVGIANIISGTVDIADASRAIKNKELKQAKENGINPVGNVVAKDGLAIIVHPSNGMTNITVEQLMKIFNGETSNWKELGGPSMPIVVISRDFSSGTFEIFKEKVLKSGKVRDDALLLASNKAVATTVKDTPGAIGYVGLGFITDEVKALTVEGIKPSVETVNDGTYAIARPLYMYTNGSPKGVVKEFIDFILSEQGQSIVEDAGYVPLR